MHEIFKQNIEKTLLRLPSTLDVETKRNILKGVCPIDDIIDSYLNDNNEENIQDSLSSTSTQSND